MRTSTSHPLQIAEVQPFERAGRIGITFCPGKVQPSAMSGNWHRDLGLDLDAVADWNAASVVTLVEDHELQTLQVTTMGAKVQARHMRWHHLPISDFSTPDAEFERQWDAVGEGLRSQLRAGFNVLVHCKGGLDRAGTIAARLMIELGTAPKDAVAAVRSARPGAIETSTQLAYVMGFKAVTEAQPATTADAIIDRAKGALLGLAIGDAVGTTLDFKTRDSYPLLTDMIGGGPFRLTAGE